MNKLSQALQRFIKATSGPQVFLIGIFFTFGLFACLEIPTGAGYDEEQHLLRVWEMSAFKFIPNESLGIDMPFPEIFYEISYRKNPLVRIVEPDFWNKYSHLSMDAHDYVYQDYLLKTRSVYSPALLFPQAVIMRYLGRDLNMPALIIYYACRIAGMMSYLVLAWFAVRLSPFGKWPLAILASTPMALFQAATINADAISNGIGLLFIGGCLAIARRDRIGWKEWIILLFLLFLLFLAKVNLLFLALLPFLIIPPSKFRSKWRYIFLVASALSLWIIEAGGWTLLAYSAYRGALGGADPAGQIKFILAQPLIFIKVLSTDLWLNGITYFRTWIAEYGYSYWSVPWLARALFLVALAAALLLKGGKNEPDKRSRIGLIIVFLVSFIGTVASLYVSFNPVGSMIIQGVQGRYFISVMPLLFLAFSGAAWFAGLRPHVWIVVACAVASVAFYSIGIYLSYHVLCGDQFYEGGLCYQPDYKNWGPNLFYSPPLSQQITLTQEIVPECNGMEDLRIWVNSSGADANGETAFILQDTTRNAASVVVTIPNGQLPEGNWYTLHFEPDWASLGKQFILTIRADNMPSRPGIRVSYTQLSEYLLGELKINQIPQDQDLVFQYGCLAGLKKILLTGHP